MERFYSKLNSFGKKYKVEVILRNGDSYYAENININYNYTSWTELKSKQTKTINTDNIHKIIFRDHLKGAAGGLLFGFLGGLILSISLVLINDDNQSSGEGGAGLAILHGIVLGVLFGTTFGGLKGDKYVFIVNASN